ncbi:alpha-ribazole phosphatase [Paenibacillus antibioticophila]|uniref:Alpha-ribazole phosphatase n=1 Tax=Paenibacillus antibioticophila TaxID=1274374 RepID=A0A919XXP6_9BACL|nr:histidine phosphatase family protein [Paenibacillus antibioticophila]GIO39959.1 alpha-ribazole phosphatase [Paenibacillus antibioticophila]
MEWWFIRHGYTEWNRSRRYLGHSDLELLSGEEAALAQLPAKLAGIRFSKVYCSDLLRCRETLARVRPDLASVANYDARIRELNFGEWEGKTYEELKDCKTYRKWIDDPSSQVPPGGESWEQFESRVAEFYGELRKNAADIFLNDEDASLPASVLIVTHGGVISLLAGKLAGGRDFHDPDFKIAPGEVLRLQSMPNSEAVLVPRT